MGKKKVPTTFRLDTDLNEKLKKASSDLGANKTRIVEKALLEYFDKIEDPINEFYELWELLNKNITSLEIKRDDRGHADVSVNRLSKDEQKTLDFYNKIWQSFREQPFFKAKT